MDESKEYIISIIKDISNEKAIEYLREFIHDFSIYFDCQQTNGANS